MLMKTTHITLLLTLSLTAGAAADTFVVDNTVDPGDTFCTAPGCTLREAITAANNNPGADTFTFNIAGTGVKTITPTTPLPTITETVTIDGYTQPGASANTLTVGDDAVLLIELNGISAGVAVGLTLNSDDSVVRGLLINRFGFDGIRAFFGTGNVIEGNFIGTDAAGTSDLGNEAAGVFLNPADGNLIGGLLPEARNLISGNGGSGVLFANGCSGNTVQGNYIGTDRNGLTALPNDGNGVSMVDDLVGQNDNVVGGTNCIPSTAP
jgi:CSLREA domain-containing protein